MEEKIINAVEKDLKQSENIQYIKNDDTVSELKRSLDILQNPTRPETTTILTNAQVNGLILMNWAGQVYDIPFFKEYVKSFPLYRISGDNGRGRTEAIKLAEAIQVSMDRQQNKLAELFRR